MADLKISREKDGTVVITDGRTGRSEKIETPRVERPFEAAIADGQKLPGHFWGRIES